MELFTAVVCFIACHGGAANHFATYATDLSSRGYTVEVYATGPALKKFQEWSISGLKEFSLDEENSQEQIAEEIAKKCRGADVVITDVGHSFDLAIQKALARVAPVVKRIAYYDNPEPYVPGGYSEIASEVMQEADKVLFANLHLAKTPIYKTPHKRVSLPEDRKIGLGYYPLEQAQKLATRRAYEHVKMREKFLVEHNLVEEEQKIFVYVGGNNTAYFSKAFPAFLRFMAELSSEQDLSKVIVILQQHPGAKIRNTDGALLEQWIRRYGSNERSAKVFISKETTENSLVLADALFYYQTSMGPQFALAGIGSVQVGHECYEDILVKNRLCLVANSAKDLSIAIQAFQENTPKVPIETVTKMLGIRSSWSENLIKLIEDSSNNL